MGSWASVLSAIAFEGVYNSAERRTSFLLSCSSLDLQHPLHLTFSNPNRATSPDRDSKRINRQLYPPLYHPFQHPHRKRRDHIRLPF